MVGHHDHVFWGPYTAGVLTAKDAANDDQQDKEKDYYHWRPHNHMEPIADRSFTDCVVDSNRPACCIKKKVFHHNIML